MPGATLAWQTRTPARQRALARRANAARACWACCSGSGTGSRLWGAGLPRVRSLRRGRPRPRTLIDRVSSFFKIATHRRLCDDSVMTHPQSTPTRDTQFPFTDKPSTAHSPGIYCHSVQIMRGPRNHLYLLVDVLDVAPAHALLFLPAAVLAECSATNIYGSLMIFSSLWFREGDLHDCWTLLLTA